jgi:hypothetical protein
MNDDKNKTVRDLAAGFGPTLERLRELQRRFRPGRPFEWKQDPKRTKRPMAIRKAERRRKNKAARRARRHNRRAK